MYITINDIIGKKRIDLSYPIRGAEFAVVIIISNNVQYWLKGPMKILLKMGMETMLNKRVYTDKELNSLIGLELKSQMVSRDDVLRTNKLENVTEMAISLEELDNSDNLEDGRPSNTSFMYYVASPEYSTCFEPVMPQYKKLRHGEIVSLTLKITDQAGSIIADGPGITVVLHIR